MTTQEFIKTHTHCEIELDLEYETYLYTLLSNDDNCLIMTSFNKDYFEDCGLIKFFAEHEITHFDKSKRYVDNWANIGFSKKENKWYGWSHRAIFGFTIGSEVKKGSCAYQAKNKEDLIEQAVDFWREDDHLDVHAENITEKGFDVVWTVSNDVPNKEVRGEKRSSSYLFPTKYGKGEWTAQTIEDAKQMAIDFADGVA